MAQSQADKGPQHGAQSYAELTVDLMVGAAITAVFFIDLFTPLGVAVWFLYVVPVGLTLLRKDPRAPLVAGIGCTVLILVTSFTDSIGIAPWMAFLNRAFGLIVIWAVALVVRSLIVNRNAVDLEKWLMATQSRLMSQLQGEFSLAQVGDRVLAQVAEDADVTVQVLYARVGASLKLVASHGLRPGTDVPDTLGWDDGMAAQAIRQGRTVVLRDLPDAAFPMRSAFVHATPRHVLITPLVSDAIVHGVVEIGMTGPPSERLLTLLERARDRIAVALRTAVYRDQLRQLLEETQRQAEELQSQQEELRVANEELEEQSRALKSSSAQLEEQQSDLELTNARLEERTLALEQQRRALVAAKREAERASRYKSEFLANMSHELRTPLNSTLILAKLLAQNKDSRLSPDEVRYAETIHASGTSLLLLINDILDLSKIEAGAVEIVPEVTPVDALVEGIDRTFRPMADDKGLVFSIDKAGDFPAAITTDASRLQQILTNLLSNAIKFTDRGSVTLALTRDGADHVTFVVRDTGPGIPEEQHHVIFEAFRQADGSTHRKHGGTGLGLSISQELAQLLGGEITVASEVGKGSTFRLHLPTVFDAGRQESEAASSHQATVAASGPSLSTSAPAGLENSGVRAVVRPPGATPDDRDRRSRPGRLILVIEDDPSFARILYDLAHELDFDCVMTSSADEGMSLAREMKPSGILLDVSLPDGSGLTLLDRLKRNPDTRHVPVHMISVADNTHTALELGAIGYAVKPVERDDLVKAIHKLEHTAEERERRVLVVEDDANLRDSIRQLLNMDRVEIQAVGTVQEALDRLSKTSFDCVVLDLTLPDASGYELLETMSASEHYSFPPVIIYTGRPLSPADEERLRRYSRSVIVKGAKSPERLLDEVTLFLHRVESRLPPDSQRLLREARERDDFFKGRRILVVEDDVRNVFALSSVFEPRGAKVTIARNGREGLERVQQEVPDLVLMDIMMPEMDGLTAMRELRRQDHLRQLPIIALTAKAMRDDYEECIAAGANDYLTKPLDVDKLLSLCRVWMSR